jgi:hypothetical protein
MQENKTNFDDKGAVETENKSNSASETKPNSSAAVQDESGAADYEKFGLACRGEEFGVFGISAFLFGGTENRKINLK